MRKKDRTVEKKNPAGPAPHRQIQRLQTRRKPEAGVNAVRHKERHRRERRQAADGAGCRLGERRAAPHQLPQPRARRRRDALGREVESREARRPRDADAAGAPVEGEVGDGRRDGEGPALHRPDRELRDGCQERDVACTESTHMKTTCKVTVILKDSYCKPFFCSLLVFFGMTWEKGEV